MIKTDTGIITVAMEYNIMWLTTRLIGHPQGIAYQCSIGMCGQTPADNPAGKKIHHNRQIAPAISGPDTGNISTPYLVWLGDSELAPEQIRLSTPRFLTVICHFHAR